MNYNLRNFISVKLLLFFAASIVVAVNCQAQLKGGKVVNNKPKKPVAGETYAIIFGVSNYPGLTPLKYADKDATLFRDFLETPAGGNTKPENIFFRINENAKAADFNYGAISWINGKLKRKELKEGDRVYIYFSGHGDAVNAKNYFLLPYDCMPNNDISNYAATGLIEMYHLKTWFIQPLIQNKIEVFIIVDACRTNDLPGGQDDKGNSINYVQSIAEQRDGEIIMLSAGAGQSAVESPKIGNGHGLFTWYLVAGLSGDADKEGDAADHDGKVSLAEITSYVKNRVRKEAKEIYNTDQVPVFLPPEKDLETIAIVDSGTYATWKLAENMRQQNNGAGNLLAVINKKPGKKAVTPNSGTDTALIALDNKFIAAIKKGQLLGKNSAESYYDRMAEKWPLQTLTNEARYTLATEFINFGQEKINLFLSGKGVVHIQRMENEFKGNKNGAANKNIPTGLSEQIDRMKTLSATGFDKAADMMEKAIILLQSDPELLDAIYPKLYFLKAASYDEVNNVSGKRLAIALLRKAIKKDSTAAYNYLIMGHLLYSLKNDSSELYFKKAISLAPKWAVAENDLANYYSDQKNSKLAIMHYNAAVRLDSLDDVAFQNLGVLYSNENKLDSARKYFLKSLAINPCDRYANCNMGTVHEGYMIRNSATDLNFNVSEKYFKKSFQCDTSFTRAYILLARLFDRVNVKDSGFYYVNLGIRRNPNDASLYRMLGDEYFDQKDTLKAETAYIKGLQVDSLDINNYTSLIWLYENAGVNNNKLFNGEKGAFAKAMQYCQKALKVDPSCAYAWKGLGDINVNLNLYDAAVPNYLQAIKIDSTYADAYNGLGNAWYYKKEYDKALLCYNKTTLLSPKFAVGYSSTGDVCLVKKDYDNALVAYQKAIVADSAYMYPYQKIGSIYAMRHDYGNAKLIYQKALKLDAAYAPTYNGLANAYHGLKSYDTALVYHKKATVLAPLNAYYYNDLAADYEELNRNDEAIAFYKKSITLDSTRALPNVNLAFVYKKTKDYDNAVFYYLKALKFLPANVYLYNSLGNIYKDQKDYKKQIYYYKKALAVDSTQSYHLHDLGFAYIGTGNYQEAITCFKKELIIYPNDFASYYDLACGFSLLNNTGAGMQYLKTAMEKGLRDYDLLISDENIGNLRKLPEFSALIKQYFPGKVK